RRHAVRQRGGRGGREAARPHTRSLLLRRGMAFVPRGRRAHRRTDRSPEEAARLRRLVRPNRLHRGRARASKAAARRPDRRTGWLHRHEDPGHGEEGGLAVAIVVGNETKLVVQGATGREGSFHTLRNRSYGTDVVAGVTPGKGGQDLEGIPIFDTVAEAVEEAGANTSMVFVPARFAADAIYESVDSGIGTVICIAEGLPAHEMLRIYNYI